MKKVILIFTIILIIPEYTLSSTDSGQKSDVGSIKQKDGITSRPKIYKLEIISSITNSYSSTTVVSKIKNVANATQETTFDIILPDSAFISGFIMEINEKNYTAFVKEKREAFDIYKQAVEGGTAAAQITTRDSTHFTVSVNIEPEAKAIFYFSYEEFLKRKNGKYEQVINIYPKQLVEDIGVTVTISESKSIVNLKTPPLRSGNEIDSNNAELDPRADIEIVNDTAAIVRFSPNLERQKQLGRSLGTNQDEGFGGQFVVQYDVDRDPSGGEVLVRDGYFVHFFAPSDLKHIPRHVVFILDTSASMQGQKIEQLRDAMLKILEELHEEDLFSLIVFGSSIKVFDIDSLHSSVVYPSIIKRIRGYCAFAFTDTHYDSLQKYKFPKAYLANKENIEKTKEIIRTLEAYGATDILSALNVGLHLTKLTKQSGDDKLSPRPIIIFLSDGAPTIRELDVRTIASKITNLNSDPYKALIFTLSFGEDADKKFLQKLALDNSGFSRHIYEAADASLQLQDFYKQISSPLLFDVKFKYVPEVTSLTQSQFPVHFDGSELVVAGWSDTENVHSAAITGWGAHGNNSLTPNVHQTTSDIERLWAYLTIKQLLEKVEYDNDIRKRAIDLALKYSFVTPLTSLVVVKPNDTVAYGDNTELGNTPTKAPPIDRTTPYCRELYFPTEKAGLLVMFPWMKDILGENENVKLQNGEYKLGLDETITDDVDCPKTPSDTPGKCKLLNNCFDIFHLNNVTDFIEHSCILKNEFIGMCCTDK